MIGTLMSHSLRFFPVMPLSFAMIICACRSLLIALGSALERIEPTSTGTFRRAVTITPVALGANCTCFAAVVASKPPITIGL